MSPAARQRLALAIAIVIVVPAGLWLRLHGGPAWLRNISGAVLYEVLLVLIARLVWLRAAPWKLAAAVFVTTSLLELTQSCDAAWLIAIRDTWPGRLVLGTNAGFDPADIPLYVLGCAVGWALLVALQRYGTGGARSARSVRSTRSGR